MDLLTTLVLGNYVFTAGCYMFTWRCYRELINHRRTELRDHLRDDCQKDCFYCEGED